MKVIILVLVLGVTAKMFFPEFHITEEYAPWVMLVGFFAAFGPIMWDCVRKVGV